MRYPDCALRIGSFSLVWMEFELVLVPGSQASPGDHRRGRDAASTLCTSILKGRRLGWAEITLRYASQAGAAVSRASTGLTMMMVMMMIKEGGSMAQHQARARSRPRVEAGAVAAGSHQCSAVCSRLQAGAGTLSLRLRGKEGGGVDRGSTSLPLPSKCPQQLSTLHSSVHTLRL